MATPSKKSADKMKPASSTPTGKVPHAVSLKEDPFMQGPNAPLPEAHLAKTKDTIRRDEPAVVGKKVTPWMPMPTLPKGKVDDADHDHSHVVHGMGWYEPHNYRKEQEARAVQILAELRSQCMLLYNERKIPQEKWTNDPQVFPLNDRFHNDPHMGIVAFPPHDQQFYIQGIYDPLRTSLRDSAKPQHEPDVEGNSSWVRLSEMVDNPGLIHLFQEPSAKSGNGRSYNYGRVMQGSLDNGYFVEAMNALTLRPRLVKHLFYCYDIAKSIYIMRLFKHGTWYRIELDDYVPIGYPVADDGRPICCRSEHFPYVIWPSLVEKAYAKLHTRRGAVFDDSPLDRGGWEAIGGGGRVEDALVLLTGGVAGRFRTRDVTADRLFVYLYEFQQDCLFVCRVNEPACEMYGVTLNPYYPYAVNRAVTWEGRLFVQVFSAAPVCFDGSLEFLVVPYSLLHCSDYPETAAEGFFWCDINDFHLYFDTIIECHLTNTPFSAIPGMPPTRLPLHNMSPSFPAKGKGKGKAPYPGVSTLDKGKGKGMAPLEANFGLQGGAKGVQHISEEGEPIPFFEIVWANPGVVTGHNAPEFEIVVPGANVPCEVFCSIDQYDHRVAMQHPEYISPASILLKVYEKVDQNYYKDKIVAKSNWMPINHAMVGFRAIAGGTWKVVAEFTHGPNEVAQKMIFRCYSSRPGVEATAQVGGRRHLLVKTTELDPYHAVKWSLVGSVPPTAMENPDEPMELDPYYDSMRQAEWDVSKTWKEVKDDCSVM